MQPVRKHPDWLEGVEHATSGRRDEAHEAFTRLADERPDEAGVWRWLANIATDDTRRIEYLEKALALQPLDQSTRGELHQHLVRRGVQEAQTDRAVARATFERASSLMPDDEIALLWWLEVCDAVFERIEALERLVERRPDDRSVSTALSRDLVRAGDAARAEGEANRARRRYQRARDLDPENADALFRLASDERVGPVGRRLELAEKVILLHPEHAAGRALYEELSRLAVDESSTLPVRCCPFCRAPKEPTEIQCDGCGARWSLFDVEALLANQDADLVKLQRAVDRFNGAIAAGDEDWTIRRHLLVAWLHLGDLGRAAEVVQDLLDRIPLDEPQRLEIEQVRVFLVRSGALDAAPAADAKTIRRVLVVDDSPTVRTLVGATLEDAGYQIAHAGTGMEALAQLRKEVPDLVLLDIGLPNMDGFQLCQLLRQNPATAELPVIMLSARDGFYDKVQGRMVGCQDYVTKPFDPADLIDRVGHWIEEMG
ncbi:MAG: response regulator [Acidobacteriota bacterium]